MRVARSPVIAPMAWLIALSPLTAVRAADDAVRLEITNAETAAFQGAVALTIKYTNTSEKPVSLRANGSPAHGGFPGETFEITTKAGRKTYTVFAVDPLPLETTIEPGKSWTRTIKDLGRVLSSSGVLIDGKHPKPTDPVPDPFGRSGEVAIRVLFESTVKNEPGAFNGKLTSNTVRFNRKLR